jgi:hypothetical protein
MIDKYNMYPMLNGQKDRFTLKYNSSIRWTDPQQAPRKDPDLDQKTIRKDNHARQTAKLDERRKIYK